MKYIICTFFIIILLIVFALSPIFNIEKINVQGNTHYKSEDIIGVTNLCIGNNWFKTLGLNINDIFTFRNTDAENSILKNRAYIKNVYVNYIFFNKVLIDIVERTPLAYVPYFGTNLSIDNEKYILDAQTDIKATKLPIIKGLNINTYELGHKLNVSNSDSLDAFLKICKIIKLVEQNKSNKLFNMIDYIDVSDINKICVGIDSRIVTNLGNIKNIDNYKINFLNIVFFTRLGNDDKGFLDFSTDKDPTFKKDS